MLISVLSADIVASAVLGSGLAIIVVTLATVSVVAFPIRVVMLAGPGIKSYKVSSLSATSPPRDPPAQKVVTAVLESKLDQFSLAVAERLLGIFPAGPA